MTVAAFFTAVQTLVQQENSETLNEVYSWLLGSLSTAGWHEVTLVLPYVVLASLVLLLHRRTLDVLAVGDDEARSLGVDVARVRPLLVAAATLATAAAVAVAGLIGFVGIVVPHLVRLTVGSSYRVIPLSMAVGAAFLVFADVVARTIISPAELPIGVVTAFIGAPFFALVLRTRGPRRERGRARNLVVDAGGRRIVDGVSLDVAAGEWLSPSGRTAPGRRRSCASSPGSGPTRASSGSAAGCWARSGAARPHGSSRSSRRFRSSLRR